MICAHLQQISGARLDEPDLSVPAGGGEGAAVCAERHGEDHVCVVADRPHRVLYHRFQTVQVPDHHLCVGSHTHTFSTKTSRDSFSSLNQCSIITRNDQMMSVSLNN